MPPIHAHSPTLSPSTHNNIPHLIRCELCGYAAEQVLGDTCRILQGPGTCAATLRAMRSAALARAAAIGVKLVNYANGARPFINLIFMAPLPEENPTHLVALLRVRFLRIDDAQAFGDGGAARAFQLEEEGDGNGGLPDEEGREGRPGGCGSLAVIITSLAADATTSSRQPEAAEAAAAAAGGVGCQAVNLFEGGLGGRPPLPSHLPSRRRAPPTPAGPPHEEAMEPDDPLIGTVLAEPPPPPRPPPPPLRRANGAIMVEVRRRLSM